MDVHSVFSVENPLVDFIARVDARFLAERGKRPGTMHLIDEAESAALVAALQDPAIVVAPPRSLPGGSAANTLRGVAWLDRGGDLARPLFGGAVGRDALGDGYRAALVAAGVEAALVRREARTGTSIILVTPDGERTMNTNLGACRLYRADDLDLEGLVRSRILYLTGYLWDTDNQRAAAEAAAEVARANGVTVAFDLADPWVVERYHERFRDWVPRSVDLLFANGKELALLTGAACDGDCMAAAAAIAPTVVMKVGARGCWVGGRDSPRAELVPTEPVQPLDTTGAGDSFAGGWLYAMLRGREPVACARLANAVARGIVGVYGCDYEAVGDPPS